MTDLNAAKKRSRRRRRTPAEASAAPSSELTGNRFAGVTYPVTTFVPTTIQIDADHYTHVAFVRDNEV